MRTLFSSYPSVLFKIILLVGLQQVGYFSYLNLLSTSMYDYTEEIGRISHYLFTYFFLFNGVLMMLGGFIADRVKHVKTGLLWSISVILLGNVLVFFPSDFSLIVSDILVTGGGAVFLILCYLHLAVFFSTADDYKDNIFILLIIVTQVMGVLATVFNSATYGEIGIGVSILIQMGIYLLLIILIYQFKDLGYAVEEESIKEAFEEDTEDTAPDVRILVFATILNTIIWVSTSNLSLLGQAELVSVNYNPLLAYLPYVGFVVIMISSTVFLLRNAQPKSHHISKFILGFGLLIGVGIAEFLVRGSQFYQLDQFLNGLPNMINTFLLFPILLSVITHINFDYRAGLWLGVLIAIPQIALDLVNQFASDFPLASPLIALLLIVTVFIWLRENREMIQEILRLEDANQIEDDHLDEDPFDHLVER